MTYRLDTAPNLNTIIAMRNIFMFFALLALACNKLPVGGEELESRGRFDAKVADLDFNASLTESKYIPLGTSLNLIVGKGSGYESHIILKFQFTDSLTQGADTIEIILFRNTDFDRDTIHYSMHLLTSSFNEAEATWQRRTVNDGWTTPGGDYNPDSFAMVSARSDTDIIYINYNELLAIKNSYGVILIPRDSGFAYYKARESGTYAQIRMVKNGVVETIPISVDMHLVTGPTPFYTDNWIGAGMVYHNYVKFDLDTVLLGQRAVYAELTFRVGAYLAHRDSISLGIRTLLKPLTGFDTKTTSLAALQKIDPGDTLVSMDIIDYVQRIIDYPDSNFGFFIAISPDNYDISWLKVMSGTYRLKVGYIEPPGGR